MGINFDEIEQHIKAVLGHNKSETHLTALILQSLLRQEVAQAETNNLLGGILKVLSPTYHLEVQFEKENTTKMSTSNIPPSETGVAGTQVIGVPTEFETVDGVTSPFKFDPSKIVWTVADPTIASITADPATGQGLATLLKAGTTTGTVTDSVNNDPLTFDLVVTAAAIPGTFTMQITWQPVSATAGGTQKPPTTAPKA
jgi:hypothetical protein